ncbi:IPP1 [Cyberlindnera jadinii]|uniref:inorganic diphosphatase n=2 Tax=Cyberlindnera jadinii (strain ATCC 18201 / CBS 1600 / BCRC 20928 / JCM 3617 / NBRC 0987 / NRRL Y-1542) TaxID=983966 RepID=A0A0H5BZK0_CYBJN|nr:IPP1 [Cyberlindnera jadinii]
MKQSLQLFTMASRRLSSISQHVVPRQYSTLQVGAKYTNEFQSYVKLANGEIGSCFHDVPLGLDKQTNTVNALIEIPRWSNAKFEINKEIAFNPITQDSKKGKPRFVKNLFPFKGYIHNYGAIPQTWDDPTVEDVETGFRGDNDPIDVCEIGSRIAQTGEIYRVKVLGALALIDDGELDWKVIVIDTRDPLSKQLSDIEDVERDMPGLLDATRRWFREYKLPDGKPKNEFGYEEQFLNASKAIEVIEHSHQSWKKLIQGEVSVEKVSIKNVTLNGTPGYTSSPSVQESIKPDAKIPDDIEKSYFY